MTSSSCPPWLQTLPPTCVLEAVPVPRDSLVAWSLSAPNQTCVIYTLWRIQNIYSAPTETVTWSIHCWRIQNWSKEFSSTQTIVNLQQSDCSISCYKRKPLFMTCLCFHHSFLTQPTMFVYYAFLSSKHLSRNLYYTMWYSIFISHVFVPCPFSLPIYKIIHYILALKRNQSIELLLWSIASPNFKTKLKYLP